MFATITSEYWDIFDQCKLGHFMEIGQKELFWKKTMPQVPQVPIARIFCLVFVEPLAGQFQPPVHDVVHLGAAELDVGPGEGAVDDGHAAETVGLDHGGGIGSGIAGVLEFDLLADGLADGEDAADEDEQEQEHGQREQQCGPAVVADQALRRPGEMAERLHVTSLLRSRAAARSIRSV